MRESEADALEWSVRPVSRRPGLGISALVVATVSVYAAFHWGGPALGIFGLLVLGGGIGSFFVTTRYRLTPESVEVRSPFQRTTRPWSEIKRVYVGPQGVSLSPFSKRHLLEPYRSIMLRYGDLREEVLAWVQRYGPQDGETPE